MERLEEESATLEQRIRLSEFIERQAVFVMDMSVDVSFDDLVAWVQDNLEAYREFVSESDLDAEEP